MISKAYSLKPGDLSVCALANWRQDIGELSLVLAVYDPDYVFILSQSKRTGTYAGWSYVDPWLKPIGVSDE